MIQVIENFVEPIYATLLYKTMIESELPFYFRPTTVLPYETPDQPFYIDKNTKDASQFTHTFTNENQVLSNYFNLVKPLVDESIKIIGEGYSLLRMKSNLITPTSKQKPNQYFAPHLDRIAGIDAITVLYYVNDSDGDTLFFESPDEKRIEGEFKIFKQVTPKQGSAAIFTSSILHANKSPINSDARCVINMIFQKGK